MNAGLPAVPGDGAGPPDGEAATSPSAGMPARRPLSGAAVLQATLLLAACLALGWRAWIRWGPVPEHSVPPGAEVRQWSVTTCGPAAVATLLNVYGRPWSWESLERECRVTAAGASFYDLREACRRHGLRAEGQQATGPRGLLRVPRPYIAYLGRSPGESGGSGHFVVVERLRNGRLEVFDPTSGIVRSWSPVELYQRGNGWVLRVAVK